MGKSRSRLRAFEHTHLGVYFVGCISAVCWFVESSKGIMEKYEMSRKWFYLYGILCVFAYLYVHPLIRKGIGSASSGYINFYAVYIFWLCSAVFCHLPKMEELGMDVKAEVSMLLSVFLITFVFFAFLNGVHYFAVSMKLIRPFLFFPGIGHKEFWSAVALNSMTVAVACSTYYSFCGNTANDASNAESGGLNGMMCGKWLHPISIEEYPHFKKLVLYAESVSYLTADVISPVFMIWLTLFTMYLANCTADHMAVQTLEVEHMNQLRRHLSEPSLDLLQKSENGEKPLVRSRSRSLEVWRSESAQSESSGDWSVDGPPPENGIKIKNGDGNVQPDFLPMVPWYCGTSADLIKVSFDLTVSLKLFLGRFDMRTMQAATSPCWNSGPCHGDGFTYEHLKDSKEELWFDFCADTGDGGNPTYTVARAMACPQLKVSRKTIKGVQQSVFLPRADVMFLGGDLAYPGPTKDTYEQRLFAPFQAALPPPPHDRHRRLVVHKPDLPKYMLNNKYEECKKPKAKNTVENLREYEGPQCFAIPGNHDWHDGLETYIEHILHRGWLGGWLLPQEKSYFAVSLPHNWWLFGLDLALVLDIDMCQYRYFTDVVEKRLNEDSQVIIMTHEPVWLEDWVTCTVDGAAPNLRELIRERLRGRARVHLAGDLHFYMRHSVLPQNPKNPKKSPKTLETQNPKNLKPCGVDCNCGNNPDLSQEEGGGVNSPMVTTLENKPTTHRGQDLNKIVSDPNLGSFTETQEEAEEKLERNLCENGIGIAIGGVVGFGIDQPNPLDPEHLIVNGLGGAFLHPTHVFSGATVTAKMCEGKKSEGDFGKGGKFREDYSCKACYPSAEESIKLGRENLFRFRLKNTRFDVVGALWYFLLVWSVLPRCTSVSAILDAKTYLAASHQLLLGVLDTGGAILSQSYISLLALLWMLLFAYGFACKGAVGCAHPPHGNLNGVLNGGRPWLNGFNGSLKEAALRGYKVRTGGNYMRMIFAVMHALTHLFVAIVLLLVLELGVVTCIRYGSVGKDGYHSMYQWFESTFLEKHFPDPMGLRAQLEKISFGLYPQLMKHMMALFDVPEAVAVVRIKVCEENGNWEELSRLQTWGYYFGMLAYYWLLAPPVMGLIFGVYLYISCCIFHVHYDEAFSALRIQNYKGFSRLHITPKGDLEIFSLAAKNVPTSWKEDPCWRGQFGGRGGGPSHKAEYPSRWVPDADCHDELGGVPGLDDGVDFQVIDYLLIPRKRSMG